MAAKWIQLLSVSSVDILVLDVMLPDEDGLSLCRRVRAARRHSHHHADRARSQEVDRIVGLEMGADDYVTKPFSSRELLARIRAVLRAVLKSLRPSGATVAARCLLSRIGAWTSQRASCTPRMACGSH